MIHCSHQILDTTLIIPQFNHAELTIHAVESLRKHDPQLWPVLIVDNGSQPDQLRQLHDQNWKNVSILSLSHSGVTRAWNAGLLSAQTQFAVLLNNDTVTRGPWINRLLEPLRAGTHSLSVPEVRREHLLNPPQEVPSGWCFAVSIRAYQQVGGFDEAMSIYFSDTDFFLRMEERFHSSPWAVVAALPVTHLGHRTAHRLPNQPQQWRADRERFLFRWQDRTHSE